MADSPFIIDVTRENFGQVMETSFSVPVLIDFWASWCQPCMVLMPILAKLAEEYQGKFLLGKLNTEEEQEIAAQFGIRSIPTVKLVRDGQIVDEFMGALPETAVREFLDRHIAGAADEQLEEADRQLAAGNLDAAAAVLDSLPAHKQDDPQAVALRSRLYFAGLVADVPAPNELATRLASDPDDHEARLQLALHKVIDQDYEAAMELLLELMRADRNFGDDAGRNMLLKVFELLGDDPLVNRYRSRMASLIY